MKEHLLAVVDFEPNFLQCNIVLPLLIILWTSADGSSQTFNFYYTSRAKNIGVL